MLRFVSLVRKQKFAEGVDLRPLELVLVELGLREDVVHLQAAHLAEKARLERKPRAPVAGSAHPREQVEHGVEAGTQAPAREMSGLDAKAAMPEPQLVQEFVEAAVLAFECREVLVDVRSRLSPRSGPTCPPARTRRAVCRVPSHRAARSLVEITNHDRDREAAEKHLVVVEPKPSADQVEAGVDVLGGPLEAVLDLFRGSCRGGTGTWPRR